MPRKEMGGKGGRGGDRGGRDDRDGERGGKGGGRGGRPARRKVCRFCADANIQIDYKDPHMLRYFITERGKIIPRRISANCSKHQRKVSEAIKRARTIALMPFTVTGQ
jgi:small subunit ribosomal protein S18